MSKAIWMLLFLLSCAGKKNEAVETKANLFDLSEQKRFYLEQAKPLQDKHGFIESKECDSLLFSGLAWGSGFDVDIREAEFGGAWFRTPDRRCYDEGRSSSDISRDMLVGLEFGAYLTKDHILLNELYDFGDSHKWVMGRGPLDYTYFLPQFQNTLRILIGKDDNLPEVWVDPLKDHQRHIVALNIILRGEAEGNIRDDELKILEKFKKLEPRNALFQYGVHRFKDGDQSDTIVLLDELFPKDHLPTNEDRCGRWLWERSETNPAWRPCKEKKRHTGGDFIFLVTLLERSE